ncbi:hypothetical protein GCK72_011537 [Caenorhabditis remanei]|uniref:Uncharacterized protein n=1 Tax=Caenorhabditis remanei TaxID=31234 RepID=A0A6A5H8W1_CAERE|nr:hypothetical protein GCK72_011537 [Caenorhabditis remanei]KAF1763271.1 hypothetical protein GCK72_011537 [Caenorhabditis remanei]
MKNATHTHRDSVGNFKTFRCGPYALHPCAKAAVSASDATEKMDCEEILNVTDDTAMMVAESTAPTTIDGPRVAMSRSK